MSSREKQSLTATVWQHVPSTYDGSMLVVMLKLAGLSSNKEGHAFIRVEPLAAMCGIKPRALQYLTQKLKKAKLLSVHKRKGHSNLWFLNVEEIKKLPLVSGQEPEEVTEEQAEPSASAASAEATDFAVLFEAAVRKDVKSAKIPDDWKSVWPGAVQTLVNAGHTVDLLKKVARFALNSEYWRNTQLEENAMCGFAANFELLLKNYSQQTTERAA